MHRKSIIRLNFQLGSGAADEDIANAFEKIANEECEGNEHDAFRAVVSEAMEKRGYAIPEKTAD